MQNSVFTWSDLHLGKVRGELKYRSDKFYEEKTGHYWYLEVEQRNIYPLIRLCLASIDSKTLSFSVKFTFHIQESTHAQSLVSGSFVFSSSKLASEFYGMSSNQNYIKDRAKVQLIFNEVLRASIPQDPDHNAFRFHKDKVTKDFLSFLQNGDFHDVTIVVDSKEIKCHKYVLCWRSSYFDAMFKSGLRESLENRIEITDFDYETIKIMIDFLYTFECPEFRQSAMSLLKAADKYQILDLKDICEKHLTSEINTSNVMDVLLYADACSANEVKKRAMDFIWKNVAAFKKAEQYEPLMVKPDLFRELMMAKANAE